MQLENSGIHTQSPFVRCRERCSAPTPTRRPHSPLILTFLVVMQRHAHRQENTAGDSGPQAYWRITRRRMKKCKETEVWC